MGTIIARKRKDGSIGYTAQILIKRKNEIVYRQALGLTRFGGHPEGFARGVPDAQDSPAVFA